ncbi:MAG: alpha-1,4-glucan--maltose-1-phosphate maltosyltransferase [Xanthobacteraceae bacterium]|uniref:alpha-1,4-glucan--maltose-1-phosphate maltosyltransferase n=1 Tax=Pseudolabrys sp. TaxID=1960880 RepID=UPI003D0C03C4
MGGPVITHPNSAISNFDRSPSDPTGPRFLIENIFPAVDGGRYPVKRIAGEAVAIWADIFRDGHDQIRAALRWRRENANAWQIADMQLHSNDRFTASFVPPEPGRYLFQIEAWTDRFASWRKGALLKKQAGQDISLELREGLALARSLMPNGGTANAAVTAAIDNFNRNPEALLSDDLGGAMAQTEVRTDLSRSATIPLLVEREKARASAWYEMVPRSQSSVPGQHGTFEDCIARVPEIAALGFDVLYLTPIHPIGRTNRKGRNNSLTAEPGDPGSFYAVGDATGGHDAVHPQLGNLADFRRLVDACRTHGMEVALDIAVQCSPDHPWLTQHPEWFKRRPDGSIKFAENPPKKYEDIVNPDFSAAERIALWQALRDVLLFWVEQGVEIFRIDNPHTKPLPFWEWVIHEVHQRNANVIFLSEAFTRPKLMKALAKLGFSQSYSYFTWRTTKQELQEYLSELIGYPEREYFRPNFFVTTPDILPVQLQTGETWLFKSRVALAALLSSNYGIYNGFELIEHEPLPGREEYLNSDKYEIRTRDWNKPGNIKPYLAMLNRLRREHAALRQTDNLRFLQVEDDGVIGFIKEAVDGSDGVAGAIAITPNAREFWLHFGDAQIGGRPVVAIENLLTGEFRRLEWGGTRLRIDPQVDPALLFRCVT